MGIRRLAVTVVVTALAATSAVAVTGAAPAQAAGPAWSKLSSGTIESLEQTGVVRMANGRLAAVWLVHPAANDWSLASAVLSPAGNVLAKGWVVQHWVGLQGTPRLIPWPGGVAVVFNGGQDFANGPYSNSARYLATSTDGVHWSLQSGSLGHFTDLNIDIAATTLADGTPVTAQGINGQIFWHVGLDPASPAAAPDNILTAPVGAVFVSPALVRATDGSVWLGYFQAFKQPGYYVQRLLPTLGAPVLAPGSSSLTQDNEPYQAVALAARSTGGVYLAYCQPSATQRCGRIELWRVGAPRAATVPGGALGRLVTLTPGPAGRLTIGWIDANRPSIDVVWTNRAVSKFGVLRRLAVPPRAVLFDNLAVDGTKGPTDLFVNVYQSGSTPPVGIWHTQILPALRLTASRTSFSHRAKVTLAFKVTDVGDPVQGVRVSFAGKVARTNAKGVAVITLPRGVRVGARRAVAVVSGWQSASVVVRTT